MKLRVLDRIEDVSAGAWNALVPADASPFLDHGYLATLELSRSVGREQDLEPKHLTLWSGDRLVAAVPAYLKYSNAYDQMIDWAHEIAKKHELPYHPKLVVGIPFSTVPSPKFLIAGDVDRADALTRLVEGAREVARVAEYPVIHVWSCTEHEAQELAHLGFCRRVAPYYAWTNEGYASFDEYLARLRNDKRRSGIRKERRRVREAGVTVRTLRGADLTADLMELLWVCNKRTVDKYDGGSDVFNHDFFKLMGGLMNDRLEVYLAERNGNPVASSFNASSASVLYPKQWGAIEEIPYVHFEVTWYHAMEEAIARGLRMVDAGGHSETKLVRGFLPVDFKHGATWIGDEDLHEAFGRLVQKERPTVDAEMADSLSRSPFRSPDA